MPLTKKSKMSKLPSKLENIKQELSGLIEADAKLLLDIMIKEAQGGRVKVKRVFKPVSALSIVTKEGVIDPYPDKDRDELILVELTEEEIGPNQVLLQYLMDKVMGKTATADAPAPATNTINFNVSPSHKSIGPNSAVNTDAMSSDALSIESAIPANYKVDVSVTAEPVSTSVEENEDV